MKEEREKGRGVEGKWWGWRGGAEGDYLIISYDDLWPWYWTALSKHSGLGGAGLFSVLPPRRRLCFAHRQAVFVLKRRAGVGETPGSSD